MRVLFDAAGTFSNATTPAVLSAATKAAIKQADLVVEMICTDVKSNSQGFDRTTVGRPATYNSLVSQVAALGNPRTALVVQSAGAISLRGQGQCVLDRL